ncbi:transmembrane protein 199-like [Littorina saxatilis]|uniref:Transmembrane protein 199 n=1 Tax=Littorina saxatilis TaxID=31220 RepID=A0AAN9AJQ4_9CAEN
MEGIEKAVPSLQLTKKLITYIDDVLRLEEDEEICTQLKQFSAGKEGSSVPFHIVRRVFKTLKDAGQDVYLHEMISGSELVLPGVTFPPRDPELEVRIKKLKVAEEEREYRRMTKNVDLSVKHEITFQEDVKSLNRQIIGVLNFLVTVVAAFAFGYKGVEVATGQKMFPLQLTTGLILGGIVFFADLYFLVKFSPE